MIGLRALVLNADMSPVSMLPLEHIPVEDAVTRVLNGTCYVVEEYDREIKTPNLHMKWPSIVAKVEYLNVDDCLRLGPRDENLYYRDHAVCAYCGQRLTLGDGKHNSLTIDHVIPKCKGGDKSWENVVAACAPCNSAKGHSLPVGQWRPRHRPYTPTYRQLVEIRRKFPIAVPDARWIPWLGPWQSEIHVYG